MRKDIPLHQYPKDVQIATHMIGLNYKRPYIRHGRRYYKPYRTNTGTGQFMRVSVTMQTGDVLLIDTNDRHQVITLNGVNYYQRIDRRSEPFKLEVGDNYLEYDADGNYTNLDVNLFYTPKYLGV